MGGIAGGAGNQPSLPSQPVGGGNMRGMPQFQPNGLVRFAPGAAGQNPVVTSGRAPWAPPSVPLRTPPSYAAGGTQGGGPPTTTGETGGLWYADQLKQQQDAAAAKQAEDKARLAAQAQQAALLQEQERQRHIEAGDTLIGGVWVPPSTGYDGGGNGD